jgi:hypothetical protein
MFALLGSNETFPRSISADDCIHWHRLPQGIDKNQQMEREKLSLH